MILTVLQTAIAVIANIILPIIFQVITFKLKEKKPEAQKQYSYDNSQNINLNYEPIIGNQIMGNGNIIGNNGNIDYSTHYQKNYYGKDNNNDKWFLNAFGIVMVLLLFVKWHFYILMLLIFAFSLLFLSPNKQSFQFNKSNILLIVLYIISLLFCIYPFTYPDEYFDFLKEPEITNNFYGAIWVLQQIVGIIIWLELLVSNFICKVRKQQNKNIMKKGTLVVSALATFLLTGTLMPLCEKICSFTEKYLSLTRLL